MTNNALGPAWPERPALFLDLDGTLLEFADTPDGVELTARFKHLLGRLSQIQHGAIAFVSGRTIVRLDEILAPYRFALAGVHGGQRRKLGGELAPSANNPAALDPVRSVLRGFEAANPGILVEDKDISLAVHYRLAPALRDAVARLGTDLAKLLPPAWELLEGNNVLEIKPAGLNKGAAIRSFMAEPPFAGRTPVFVGDDVTDEDGFRVVNELGGVSIKVNSGPTEAQWHLADVDAVLTWLEANVPSYK